MFFIILNPIFILIFFHLIQKFINFINLPIDFFNEFQMFQALNAISLIINLLLLNLLKCWNLNGLNWYLPLPLYLDFLFFKYKFFFYDYFRFIIDYFIDDCFSFLHPLLSFTALLILWIITWLFLIENQKFWIHFNSFIINKWKRKFMN